MLNKAIVWVTIISAGCCLNLDDEVEALSKNVSAYAALHGMQLDPIKVNTSDGWQLEIHRVRSMQIYNDKLSTPVLLSHGFGCSSIDWMVNPRNESLAFLLADRGFDVWAINYRANKFSNKKIVNGTIQDPTSVDYYRATWQYMAENDIPAVLETIFIKTKQEKIYLIGQSMGTAALFAFLSQKHQYDDKVILYSAIVPVIKFGTDTSTYLKTVFELAPVLPKITQGPLFNLAFGRQIVESTTEKIGAMAKFLGEKLCKVVAPVCRLLSEFLVDTESKSLNDTDPHIKQDRFKLYKVYYPAGVTALNMFHFARQFKRNPWTKMNYDELPQTGISNIHEYGQNEPPAYNFTNIRVPLNLYFTKNDRYVGVDTAKAVIGDFGLKEDQFKIIDGNRLSHHDTLWGWDARCYVYDPIIDRMNKKEMSRSAEHKTYHEKFVAEHLRSLRTDYRCGQL